MSLVSRHLEANGIPTVVIGSARDIVEECGVARFLFSDFPLGNPCGKPYDVEMQRAIVGHRARPARERAPAAHHRADALPLERRRELEAANYARLDPSEREALRRAGEQRRAQQRAANRREEPA